MEQDLRNKRGEVEFRRRLFRQQVEGDRVFADELDADGIETILRERMDDTRREMEGLRSAGVRISPYLEIGAERGQRALVLENELGASGAALDLSLDLLRSCEHYRDRFGLERLPLRVCADAYRLPFRSGSLPFVFCYQTLHHFPRLEPILAEVHRVLAPGGHFFFAEVPFRRVLHWGLIRAKGKVGGPKRSALRRLLRAVFVEERYNEEDFGVLENHDIPISAWKSALRGFEHVDATLELAGRRVDAYRPRNPLLYLAMYLLGGRIGGVCRKAGELRGHAATIEDALVSPTALLAGRDVPVAVSGSEVLAENGERFPLRDGVAILMAPETLAELYPEIGDA